MYSQDTERQTQKTRTKTQLASFLRHSTLSLSHALLRLATTSTKEGDTTESRSLHHQQYLETYPAVRVCSLSSPTPLSPHTAMPRIQKKSICAHTRRHCIAIGILHPPPAHAATSKGNEEGHTKRGTQQGLAKAAVPAPRPTHSTRCSRVHSPSLRAPQTRYAPGPGVCAARWSRRSASKRSSSPKDRDGYEHLLSSTWRPSDDWSVYLSGDGENLP